MEIVVILNIDSRERKFFTVDIYNPTTEFHGFPRESDQSLHIIFVVDDRFEHDNVAPFGIFEPIDEAIDEQSIVDLECRHHRGGGYDGDHDDEVANEQGEYEGKGQGFSEFNNPIFERGRYFH